MCLWETCYGLCGWELTSSAAEMADFHAPLSRTVLRNLADKLYEKRKAAALEVEEVVRALTAAKDHQTISKIIALLTYDFVLSPQANHRKSSIAKEEYKATKPGEQGRAGLSGSNRVRDNPPNFHPLTHRASNLPNGGVIALAAATVGLASDAVQHLEKIVPPIISSFSDEDSRVRYYACEALYNIARAVRGDFIVFFNDIFDALCKLSADADPNVQGGADLLDRLVKDIVTVQDSSESDQFSIDEFIPLLRERMNVLNPFVRRFLVGWITELDKVPAIDMLGFLPDFLDGLFNMLSDSSREIRQQADLALKEFMEDIQTAPSVDYGRMAEILVQRAGSPDEFTRLTAITWINEFVKLGGDQLVPYFADILGVVLPAISDREEKIPVVARETNEEMRTVRAEPSEGFDIGAVLVIARRELGNNYDATRLEALRWISVLLERHRTEVLSFLDDIFPALLRSLSDSSDEVAHFVLEVLACIARDPQHFRHLMGFLVHLFNSQHSLLERRGTLAVRRLCQLLGAERVYRELAAILHKEGDLVFATIMVQALNLILLTAPELADLRGLLKGALSTPGGQDLFVALYASWCHSPTATVSLCLLAQAYQHASSVIQSLGETDISVNLLVQLDKLVRLLETPIFAYLRLQLLEPARHPHLLKTLYGLLMLLPQQSSAFKVLRTRLKTVPSHSFMHTPPNGVSNPSELPGLSTMRRAASAGPFTAQILAQSPPLPISSLSLQPTEDAESSSGVAAGSNFASQLRHFEQLQYQHRSHNAAENESRPPRRPPIASNQNAQGAEDVADSQTSRGAAQRSPRGVAISPRYGAQSRS